MKKDNKREGQKEIPSESRRQSRRLLEKKEEREKVTAAIPLQVVIFHTAGNGLWSKAAKPVRIISMRISYLNEEEDLGDLRIRFDNSWNVRADGLIYTDKNFLSDLREFLIAHGLAGADVDYSEQGVQGENDVSCDVRKNFLDSWKAKFGEMTNVFVV